MPRKNRTDRDREAEADDLLLRALRQLADEALEEEVPERLLRPLREAQSRQQGDGADPPRRQDAERGSSAPGPASRRPGAGSG
jgi:hypothetical protein